MNTSLDIHLSFHFSPRLVNKDYISENVIKENTRAI